MRNRHADRKVRLQARDGFFDRASEFLGGPLRRGNDPEVRAFVRLDLKLGFFSAHE